MAQKLYSAVASALPQACVLCAAPAGRALVCAACTATLPRLADPCPGCALPARPPARCAQCAAHPPPWRRATAALRYAFPADELVQALKYGGQVALGAYLGALVADAVVAAGAPQVDLVVPVPLAAARMRERGYNQAHALARAAALALGLDCRAVLVRTRASPPQASLPLAARGANVAGAFACAGPVAGRRLALVDDVMTSGATLAAATGALLAAGALSVDVWVAARTP
ncbi:MAG: ComF family protein [Proteobacteria bacterium]|nr:ComF family protein [Pseudomonadota bacterium]